MAFDPRTSSAQYKKPSTDEAPAGGPQAAPSNRTAGPQAAPNDTTTRERDIWVSMRHAWLGALLWAVGWTGGCGAVTLEPLPPEEPLPEAAPPPRLLRRDAGADAGKTAEDNPP